MIPSGFSLSKNILAGVSGAMLKPHLGGNGSGPSGGGGDDSGLDRDGSAGNGDKGKDSGYVLEAGLTAGMGDALGVLLHVILQSLIVGILEFSSTLNLGFTECLKQKIS